MSHIMIATHNGRSVKRALQGMAAVGLAPQTPHVSFAQLLGMADALSLPLANEWYAVRKFCPYGPLEEVMPYLMRRARENSNALGAVRFDVAAIEGELWRRLRAMVGA